MDELYEDFNGSFGSILGIRKVPYREIAFDTVNVIDMISERYFKNDNDVGKSNEIGVVKLPDPTQPNSKIFKFKLNQVVKETWSDENGKTQSGCDHIR